MPEVVVLTDKPNVSSAQTDAVASFMADLMAQATKYGDMGIALNALLGAYINLARGPNINFAKAMRALGSASERLLNEARGAAEATAAQKPTSVDQLAAMQRELEARLNGVLNGQRHEVALSALINLYFKAAMQSPCCIEACSKTAADVAQQLAQGAARGTVH